MKLSLCMIVRDEAANLRECLASVDGLADELVVVDTGSRDGTKAVAARLGARVFDFRWRDDFAAARNDSVCHAKGDWILWLDADDRIDDENRARLRSVLAKLGSERNAYLMRCVSIGAGAQRALQSEQIRLFRRDERIRWSQRVHEQIAPALRRCGHGLVRTDVAITHVGYVDTAVALKKQERNLRLLDLELLTSPLNPFLLVHRGTALLDLKRPAEALVSLTLCRAHARADRALARTLYPLLVEAHAAEGDLESAAEIAAEARRMMPDDVQLAFTSAELSVERGQLDAAEATLTALLETGKEAVDADLSVRSFRARHLRGEVRLVRGAFADAESDALAVVDSCETFGQAWLLLADSLLAQGKLAEFDDVFSRLTRIPEAQTARVLLRAARHEYDGKRPRALAVLREANVPAAERPAVERFAKRLALRTAQAVPLASCISALWERASNPHHQP